MSEVVRDGSVEGAPPAWPPFLLRSQMAGQPPGLVHLAGRVWAAGRRQAQVMHRLGFDPAHWLLLLWAGLLLSPLWLGLVLESPLRYPAPLDVLDQPAVAGDMLVLRETRCNANREALAYPFTRSLRRETDGVVYLLAPGSSTAKPGCTTVETQFNLLPSYLAPGTYTLYGVASVAAWNRSYSVPYTTHPFEVAQPTPQPQPTATPLPLPTVTVTPARTPGRTPTTTRTPTPPMTPRGES